MYDDYYRIQLPEMPPMNIPMKKPAPPPKATPQTTKAYPGGPKGDLCKCFSKYTYVWMKDGREFWIWPIAIYEDFIVALKWKRNRWVYSRIPKRKIKYFICG